MNPKSGASIARHRLLWIVEQDQWAAWFNENIERPRIALWRVFTAAGFTRG